MTWTELYTRLCRLRDRLRLRYRDDPEHAIWTDEHPIYAALDACKPGMDKPTEAVCGIIVGYYERELRSRAGEK